MKESNFDPIYQEEPKKQYGFSQEFIDSKKAERHPLKRLTTVVFDDEEKYANFLDWVWDEYGGPKGLEFTNFALPMSISLYPGLLEIAHTKFPMRLATREEEKRYLDSLPGTHPFDPESIRGRHIPGLGFFKKRR